LCSADHQIDRNPPGSVRYQKTELIIKPGKSSYVLNLSPNERNTAPGAVLLHDSIGVVMPISINWGTIAPTVSIPWPGLQMNISCIISLKAGWNTIETSKNQMLLRHP